MKIVPTTWSLAPKILYICIALFSLLMACFNYSAPINANTPGLDNSWAYTINYLFQQGSVSGRDTFFTFGPLGFLEHTRPVSQAIVNYSLYFWLGMILIVNALAYRLAFATASSPLVLAFNLVIASILLLNINTAGQKILLALYVTAILAWLLQKNIYLVLLGLLSTLAICIKFSHGAVALILLCGISVTLSIHNKSLRPLLIAGTSFVLSYCIIWLANGGSIVDSARYFLYGLEFTRGSASAMATYPTFSGLAVLGVITATILIITSTLLPLKPKGVLLAGTFILVAFVWIKYSFGRYDNGHLTGIMYFGLSFSLIALLLNTPIKNKILTGLLTVGLFLCWQLAHGPQTGSPMLNTHDIGQLKKRWFFTQLRNDKYFNQLIAASNSRANTFKLSEEILERLGQNSVTIYPWENFYAHANKLNWQVMPVIQNYVAYTPKLDHRNALFFESSSAPKFIIWHHHTFASVDNRHHLSSDPRTISAILTNYQKTLCDSLACLWEKREKPLIIAEKKRQHVPIKLDQWISVPKGDMQRFYISSQLTSLGIIKNALWKESELRVEYVFDNGKTRQHRFIRENAKHGLWINPYNTAPNEDWAKHGKVKAIRFKSNHPQHYKNWIGYWSVNEFLVENL